MTRNVSPIPKIILAEDELEIVKFESADCCLLMLCGTACARASMTKYR